MPVLILYFLNYLVLILYTTILSVDYNNRVTF